MFSSRYALDQLLRCMELQFEAEVGNLGDVGVGVGMHTQFMSVFDNSADYLGEFWTRVPTTKNTAGTLYSLSMSKMRDV